MTTSTDTYPQAAEQGPRKMQMSPPHSSLPKLGWSWGAFFLTWVWAVGTRTWSGLWTIVPIALLVIAYNINYNFDLLMPVPLLYLIAAVVLGAYGRRWSWHTGRWESAEHFNRVQRRWGIAGCIIVMSFNTMCIIVAIQGIRAFKVKSNNSSANSAARSLKIALEAYYEEKKVYPDSPSQLNFTPPAGVVTDCALAKDAFNCTAAHSEGSQQYFITYTSASTNKRPYRPGEPVKATPLQ